VIFAGCGFVTVPDFHYSFVNVDLGFSVLERGFCVSVENLGSAR